MYEPNKCVYDFQKSLAIWSFGDNILMVKLQLVKLIKKAIYQKIFKNLMIKLAQD